MRYSTNDTLELGGVWRNISPPDELKIFECVSRAALHGVTYLINNTPEDDDLLVVSLKRCSM